MIITKSKFLKMLQCKKAFFLDSFLIKKREGDFTQSNFQLENGKLVGKFGQELYKGGLDLSENGKIRGMDLVNTTKEHLLKNDNEIFYEAAFASQDSTLMFQADVLLGGPNVRRIIEFKSGTYIKKPEYIFDIGFQKRVLIDAGFDKKIKFFIAHINRQYTRINGIELDKLFIHQDVTESAHRVQPLILRQLDEMQEILSRGIEPNIKVGNHCVKPNICQFYSRCWSNVSPSSIVHATTLKKWQKDRLNQMDIKTIKEIPADMKFSPAQWSELKSILKQKVEINKKDVRKFLSRIKPPYTYLNFECIISPIPLYEKTSPYTQLPTQFTLLEKSENENGFYKKECIESPGSDPRKKFVENLITNVPQSGTVIVYNKISELNKLKEAFPELLDITNRIIDLIDLFKSRHYWHSSFRNSFTIKEVLAVLCPDISYSNLNIQDETMAMKSYSRLGSASKEESKDIIKALKKYSLMNVYSILKIHEALQKI